jgi:hypothetical protein
MIILSSEDLLHSIDELSANIKNTRDKTYQDKTSQTGNSSSNTDSESTSDSDSDESAMLLPDLLPNIEKDFGLSPEVINTGFIDIDLEDNTQTISEDRFKTLFRSI